MAPIPAEIGAHTFAETQLKGSEFTAFVHTVEDLMKRRKEIVVPPSGQIRLDGLMIHIPQMFVLEGVPSSIREVLLPTMTSDNVYHLPNKTSVTNVFGVQLRFDKEPQHIIVSRGKHQVRLCHDGLQQPVHASNRAAILGLSLLPDELWPRVAKQGFSCGYITGSCWDNPWQAQALSLSLPDPDGKLSWYHTGPQVLANFDPGSLYGEILNTKIRTGPIIKTYLEKLKPVGLFFDSRQQG